MWVHGGARCASSGASLVVSLGSFPVALTLTNEGYHMWSGKGVFKDSLHAQGKPLPAGFLWLALFGYPERSGSGSLEGTLFLRYRPEKFATCTPTWTLPVEGHAQSFAYLEDLRLGWWVWFLLLPLLGELKGVGRT